MKRWRWCYEKKKAGRYVKCREGQDTGEFAHSFLRKALGRTREGMQLFYCLFGLPAYRKIAVLQDIKSMCLLF
jgi:hypothetical protein|tara:strand:- start:850 stop:1068 length:219 start_codon:yes stop_codon:yes gene_type:complete